MMIRHPGEQGISIDNNAALVLKGDGTFEVLTIKNSCGSVTYD